DIHSLGNIASYRGRHRLLHSYAGTKLAPHSSWRPAPTVYAQLTTARRARAIPPGCCLAWASPAVLMTGVERARRHGPASERESRLFAGTPDAWAGPGISARATRVPDGRQRAGQLHSQGVGYRRVAQEVQVAIGRPQPDDVLDLGAAVRDRGAQQSEV